MYLAFGNPHDPRVADKKYMDLYEREKIPLPKNFLPQHPFDNGEMTVRDEALLPWPRTEAAVRKELHEYYATITAMDFHMGRIIAALPRQVYISFDIDGLTSEHCPHTGTPVPGGITFAETCHLLELLAASGRRVVGFDLCEVAPGAPGDEWNGCVGARVLYKLIGCALRSRKLA